MKTFSKKIDLRSREQMVAFLRDHPRYHTMNSWNCSTSYANCVKVHRLDLTHERFRNALEMLDMPQVYDAMHLVLEEWAEKHEWRWQVGFNGRSGGYLVLYQGALDWKNARTAQCDVCLKLTWHTQDTPCTSDDCEGTLRALSRPRPQIVTYPGRSIDQGEDFDTWSIDELRDRVRLIQDFDRVCDEAVAVFMNYCDNYRVVEEEILVPKTSRTLEPV